jgi:hypothetical protein
MDRDKWTKTYFSGKRIKVIAIELNRSELGVNKALQRLKIRPEHENKEISQKPRLQKSFKTPQTRITESCKKCRDEWVSISKMVSWMIENGINVAPIDKFMTQYKINYIPSTLGQLLLHCNRLRLDMNLPIFKVKGITKGLEKI